MGGHDGHHRGHDGLQVHEDAHRGGLQLLQGQGQAEKGKGGGKQQGKAEKGKGQKGSLTGVDGLAGQLRRGQGDQGQGRNQEHPLGNGDRGVGDGHLPGHDQVSRIKEDAENDQQDTQNIAHGAHPVGHQGLGYRDVQSEYGIGGRCRQNAQKLVFHGSTDPGQW